MKKIIKIIIAFTFILGAFFIGKYLGTEENKSVIKVLNKKLSSQENQISTNETKIQNMEVEIATNKDSLLKMSEKQCITKTIRNVDLNDKSKTKSKGEH